MLRLKAAASAPEDFTSGGFRPVLTDRGVELGDVDRVIIASGKVVYDLEAERAKREDTRTAIIRLEQYYPLPGEAIASEIRRYPGAEVVVVQEEPENQGGWPFLALNLPAALQAQGESRPLRVVSRPASASPASGSCPRKSVRRAVPWPASVDRRPARPQPQQHAAERKAHQHHARGIGQRLGPGMALHLPRPRQAQRLQRQKAQGGIDSGAAVGLGAGR